MMSITIIATGKMKEKYMRDFVSEYEKRLSAFCKLNIVELTPSFLPDNPSKAQIEAAINDEAKRIEAKIPSDSVVYSMCIEGKQRSSEKICRGNQKYCGKWQKQYSVYYRQLIWSFRTNQKKLKRMLFNV